ncbi:MAG: sigma-54-dependent transcriptional regulator [Candidatus Brocadiia bacterium]
MDAVILIVDDDSGVRYSLKRRLSREGHEVHVASSARQGLEQLDRQVPDLVIVDLRMPEMDGLSFIVEARQRDGTVPVIAMTGYGSVETAVAAMKGGASDFIQKPFELDEMVQRVGRALERCPLRREVMHFRPELRHLGPDGSEMLLGRSPAMRQVYRTIKQLSRSASTTVLIQGESGTGKELIAQAIHNTSGRAEKPFVAVNCAALTETLLEAELFGYEQGAFTGAAATGKIGLFEAADGGTIFLDEIGEMGYELQSKLLRVLQDKRFMRVGGTGNIEVDVRVIASTNRDLAERVREGSFRHDLFFRLKVVTIHTPPLRERKDDILPLAKHFLAQFNAQFDRRIEGFSPEAEKLLLAYPWPGNVRELKNVIESCVILETGDVVTPRILRLDAGKVVEPPRNGGSQKPAPELSALCQEDGDEDEKTIAAVERRHILRVLNETMWQRTQAASILGIHRTTLANKIREYGLANA